MLFSAFKSLSVLVILGILLTAWNVQAGVGLGFALAQYEGGGIQAENLRLRFITSEKERAVFRLQIERIQLDEVDGELRDIELYCPNVTLAWPHWTCRDGTLVVADSPWGAQYARLNMDWQSSDRFSLQLKQLKYAGGKIGLKLDKLARNWRIRANVRHLSLDRLVPLREALSKLSVSSVKGVLTLDADATLVEQNLQYLAINAGLRELSYSDAEGLQVGEAIAASLRLQGRMKQGDWLGTIKAKLSEGELYSDPLYLAFNDQPVEAKLSGQWREGNRLQLTDSSLRLGKKLTLLGSADLLLKSFEIEGADLQLRGDDLAGLYQTAQPFLIGSGLDDLLLEGAFKLHATWANRQLSAIDMQLQDINLDERSGSFGWDGLQGELHWRSELEVTPTVLDFSAAHMGKVNIGAFQVLAELRHQQGQLLAPMRLPFYRGEVTVDKMQWQIPPDQPLGLSLNARVSNVDLQPLSQDLGWPYLTGQLNGEIPLLSYRKGRADLSGGLKIEVFDGQLSVSRLFIDDLDTVAPVLQTDLNLKGLDLSQLTEAFSFGRIEGRLNGEVKQLQLIDWQPNQFEAHFYTPKNDDLPHRISQRAIENLTELGNGVSGVLSGSFLRMFKTFAYDQVDLRIRQRGDWAELGGIPLAEGGYYLVKGAGLPRVDVIGRNHKVAWKDLLARLQSIRFSAPSIQ